MNQDFEWLKWVGLSIVVSILVAVYFVKNDESKISQVNQEIQFDTNKQYEKDSNAAIAEQQSFDQKAYDDKIAIATQTILENEAAQLELEKNPPVYAALSFKQTEDFFQRLEKLGAENLNINLDYLPDIAAHSREFNNLYTEAEKIYGSSDLANPYRFCTNAAMFQREIWDNTYSKSSLSEERRNNIMKRYIASYEDAKTECINDVRKYQK